MDYLWLIFSGIGMGLVAAVPVGPVNIICIRRTFAFGPLNGFLSGLGAALGDGVFAAITGLGLTWIAQLIQGYAALIELGSGLAMVFFGFNFYAIGFPLVAFFCNLIFTSWSVGIFVSGLVLRYGLGAESIVWTLMFGMMPLACIYYPVTVLPHWLQAVAWMLPPTYVFEGMRALLMEHTFRADLMVDAVAINAVLIMASFAVFLMLLRSARQHGSLIQAGE